MAWFSSNWDASNWQQSNWLAGSAVVTPPEDSGVVAEGFVYPPPPRNRRRLPNEETAYVCTASRLVLRFAGNASTEFHSATMQAIAEDNFLLLWDDLGDISILELERW